MTEIILGAIQPPFLLMILGFAFFWIMFNDLIEAKTKEIKERARKLKRENNLAENNGNTGA